MGERRMDGLDFHAAALQLQGQRQQLLASNIANADTPNFKARDIDFRRAMREAAGPSGAAAAGTLALTGAPADPQQSLASSVDGAGHVRADRLWRSNAAHLSGRGADGSFTAATPGYRQPVQGAVDGNTVDMDQERAAFADNAIHYQATLRFINARVRNLTSAIKGE